MKVSVAMCTYNGEKYLSQQIDSILNQKGGFEIEIIVCDDKSTDKTLEILNAYKHKFQHVFQIFQNDGNLGSTKNFEKAISLCQGDYIFLADQDDVWRIDKIETTLSKFQENKQIEGVFTNADLIDFENKKYSNSKLWDNIYFLEEQLFKPIDFIDLIFKNGNIVTGATLCIKKQSKEIIFPFPADVIHDEWIATVLALKNTLDYINQDLISYRIHKNQQIGIKTKSKIAKIKQKKLIVLGLLKPKKFADYRILLKKNYLKYKKLKSFEKINLDLPHLQTMIFESEKKIINLNLETKQKFPISYLFSTVCDNLLKKRQQL